MGEDVSQVPLDLPQFMLALLFITKAEYHLWKASIPYIERLTDDMEYDEFSETRLMPFPIYEVCNFPSPFPFILFFLYFCT